MTNPALSYDHGGSAIPLIGETIGVHFDRTVARWGDSLGLISPQQGVRWTWSDLGAKVDAFAAEMTKRYGSQLFRQRRGIRIIEKVT